MQLLQSNISLTLFTHKQAEHRKARASPYPILYNELIGKHAFNHYTARHMYLSTPLHVFGKHPHTMDLLYMYAIKTSKYKVHQSASINIKEHKYSVVYPYTHVPTEKVFSNIMPTVLHVC